MVIPPSGRRLEKGEMRAERRQKTEDRGQKTRDGLTNHGLTRIFAFFAFWC